MAEGTGEEMNGKSREAEPFQTIPVRGKRKRTQLEQMEIEDVTKRPSFPPAKADKLMVNIFIIPVYLYRGCVKLNVFRISCLFVFQSGKAEFRKIPVPPHRYTPLKENWMKIFTPVVEHLKLQIRFNLSARKVEIRVRTYILLNRYKILFNKICKLCFYFYVFCFC